MGAWVFRVEVWWLAVDLIGIPALGQPRERGVYRFLRKVLGSGLARGLWRWWHRRSGQGALCRRLSSIARDEIFGSSGWAGFWEQWLAGEMMLRWPKLVAEAPSESRQLLSILPLLSEAPYRAVRKRVALPAPPSLARELSVTVDARWEARRPGVRPSGVRPSGVRPSATRPSSAAPPPPAPRH